MACTDAGNAARFYHRFGDEVRYCPVEKLWYHYDGRCWSPDVRLFMESAMGQVAFEIFAEAEQAVGSERTSSASGPFTASRLRRGKLLLNAHARSPASLSTRRTSIPTAGCSTV